MKILFCTNTFQNIHHGPAKFANYILEINTKCPIHEIRILTPDISMADIHKYHNKVYQLVLRPPFFLNKMVFLYGMYPFYKRIRDIYQSYKFDCIVFNNVITGLYTALKFKNVIGMVNDDNNINASLLRPQFNKEWIRKVIFKYFEYFSIIRCKSIIVNSKYLSSLIQQKYGTNVEKICLLYKGVSLMNQTRIRHDDLIKKGTINILFVKSDFKRGGLRDLILALEKLQSFKFNLIVVGTPPKYQSVILDWGKNAIDHVNIIIKGPLEQESVFQLMKDSDIFCVPSRAEALGVANLEAMVIGLPVVTTEVGGIPETLDFGSNGWMAQPNNSASLAQQIEACIINNIERSNKCRKAQYFVENEFSKDSMLTKFSCIITKLSKKYFNSSSNNQNSI